MSIEWILAVGIAGALVGLLVGRSTSTSRARQRALEAELAAARKEHVTYRSEVGAHFGRTAELLHTMTLQYRAVYDHLAEGAERLYPEGSASLAAGNRAGLLPAGAPAEVPEPESLPFDHASAVASDSAEVVHIEPPGADAPSAPERARPETSKRILFLCTGNSCRSQMAEGFARASAPAGLEVYSAGTKPEGMNPGAIAAMAEAGIDISRQRSKGLSEVPLEDIDVVVTLCGDAAEQCPAFPGTVDRFHWPLRDPAKATGTEDDVTRVFHEVRDEIEERVLALFERLGLPTEIARVEPPRTL